MLGLLKTNCLVKCLHLLSHLLPGIITKNNSLDQHLPLSSADLPAAPDWGAVGGRSPKCELESKINILAISRQWTFHLYFILCKNDLTIQGRARVLT